MSIWNIQNLTIIGLISSMIGNIAQLLGLKKLRKQKINMANKEIKDALMPSVIEKSIPRTGDILSLINATAKKHGLKSVKLHSVEDFYDAITKELYANPALQSRDRDELMKLVRKEKSSKNQLEEEKEIKGDFFEVEVGDNNTNIVIGKNMAGSTRMELDVTTVFSDDFELFTGWKDYRNGRVVQSGDNPHSGKFCLKKDSSGDPDGGFKALETRIGFEEISSVIFTGWIYRPFMPSSNLGDRLALEDANFSGYGFCIAHNSNNIWIERRDNGEAKVISALYSFIAPKNKWFSFDFKMSNKGIFNLLISNQQGRLLADISSFVDNKYLFFTQVSVHGGFPYYVDDLKIGVV